MAATIPSTALVPVQPVFASPSGSRSPVPGPGTAEQSLLCSLSQLSGSGQGFQNVTACQVSPPLPVSRSSPSMSP